jgi:hypothetical protein
MDISQAGQYFRDLANRVGQSHAKAALAAAGDGIALIKDRVIATGENSEGTKFKDYSDVDLPTLFVKSRTGSDRLKKKIQKKTSKISYKDIREAAGLQTDHRDFKFTGRMWANIHPKISNIKDGTVTISINAINPDEQQKVKWNIEESGNFLKPNKDEIKIMAETFNKYFINELLR